MKTQTKLIQIGLLTFGLWLLPQAGRAQTLGATNLLEGPAPGTNSVVLATSGTWTASTNASWLHLSAANQSGAGSTNVVFSYDANTGATRTGSLTIAGQTVAVTQAGATYVSSPVLVLANLPGNARYGVAVDRTGNAFIDDTVNGTLLRWTATTGLTTLISPGLLSDPRGLATDGTNVYIADWGNNAIVHCVIATKAATNLITGLNQPRSVALDRAANVYIADTGNYAIKEWIAASNHVVPLIPSGIAPWGVSVDAAGNVYFSDGNQVKMWLATNGPVLVLASSNGLNGPYGMAVDGSGNDYFADCDNSAIKRCNAAITNVVTVVSNGLSYPEGVAVDGAGNLYIVDSGNNVLKELPCAFVNSTGATESWAAGTDSMPVVLPATANLAGVFTPTSDSPWLTITSTNNGVISFSFTATTTNRIGHITVLGVSVAVTQQPFSYTVSNGAATITGYNGPGGNLTIPGTLNGYPVTAIGVEAFSPNGDGYPSLTSVTLPDSVTNIGPSAFAFCTAVTNLTLGNGVVSIGEGAFELCQKLYNLTIPNSVLTVGNEAFLSCESLTNVTIGTNVISIGNYAFDGCAKLYNLTIPNSVLTVGNGAFLSCESLTNVTIGTNVISIGDGAFDYASLTSLTIPSSVASFGSYPFVGCENLHQIYFQGNAPILTDDLSDTWGTAYYSVATTGWSYQIGDWPTGPDLTWTTNNGTITITGYTGVSGNLTLPDEIEDASGNLYTVTAIGDRAFKNFPRVTSVTIPNSVTSIGIDAFFDCTDITNLILGTGVQSIGEQAFTGCADLAAVTIPNRVANIGDLAFQDCIGLTSVTIPSSVTNLGNFAFEACSSLDLAYFQGNAPSVDGSDGSLSSYVFNGETGVVFYPPGATGWGSTFGGWPTAAGVYQSHPQILGSGLGLGAQGNGFNFTISWATNAAVVVEASTNLVNWTPILTNTLNAGTNAFGDSTWTNYPQRFYRVSSP